MPKEGYQPLNRARDLLDTSVEDEDGNRTNVSEVQLSFFEDHEAPQGLQGFRRRSETSVRDRLRSGFRAFAEGHVTIQVILIYLSKTLRFLCVLCRILAAKHIEILCLTTASVDG